MRENLAATLQLVLVTDDALLAGRDPILVCRAAVQGGVTAVQLRLKQASDRALFELAGRLLPELGVPLFINDRLDIALAVGAAGVHLGPDDLSPALARRIVPAGFFIGASVGDDAEIARGAAADYWGIGPLHLSSTKRDVGAALGPDGAARILARASDRPCVVVGGVMPEDVLSIRAAGFAGVAVVRGILGEADAEVAARRYEARDK